MEFCNTNDNVFFLYPYYSLSEKNDEKSKEVYHVFKKGWGMDTFFPAIMSDVMEAFEVFLVNNRIKKSKIAITVMPSHSQGVHGESLLKLANELARRFDWVDASRLIQRTVEKTKSTEGGARDVKAHLRTLGVATEVDKSVDVYIILDDITTTGSSLEAAKQLLVANGIDACSVVKVAIAKTMHDSV